MHISLNATMSGDLDVCSAEATFVIPVTALSTASFEALAHLLRTMGTQPIDLMDRIERLEDVKRGLAGKGGPWQQKLERIEVEQDLLVSLASHLNKAA